LQRQVATLKTKPVTAIEAALDFCTSAAQPRTNLLARHTPALAVPHHRVIGSYRPRYAHAENLLQPMATFQSPVSVAGPSWRHSKALLPKRPEGDFQETIGRFQRANLSQAHFLDQSVLQGAEQPFDAPLGVSVQLRRMVMLRLDVSE
jgi:hypothetical protein